MSFNFADNVNVEHIMPSSGHDLEAIRKDAGVETREEFDELVNQLGNKILLEEDVNKSIGKSWFQTKKGSRVTDKKGYFTVDEETRETSIPSVFAGGDVAPVGQSNAINAMGAGKKAAKAINEYLAK